MNSTTLQKPQPLEVCSNIEHELLDSGIWKPQSSRTHLISPEPFPLTPDQVGNLQQLGSAILSFYQAANKLYMHKGNDWANEYLDIGKSEEVIRHSRMNYQKQLTPRVLRPDIMLTPDGFVITELDSVPGGIGHLNCLSSGYESSGFNLVGSGMRNGFTRAIIESSGKESPTVAIVVSDESEDYRAEMTSLAGELRLIGLNTHCVHPGNLSLSDDVLYVQTEASQQKVDLVYRFYELFDLENIPASEVLLYAGQKRIVPFEPSHKHFLEEKLLLALLHHKGLQQFWIESMGEKDYNTMLESVVPTWILDNRPVPPHAEISGFEWDGKSIRDWRVISEATQKQRALVIKPSGYSPLAWGSRGVKIGSDMSQAEWGSVVEQALDNFDTSPHVLQTFREGKVVTVPYRDSNEEIRNMYARVRLCPYYFVYDGKANLSGVMATACPKDKKLIHGMKDAVIAPCTVRE